MTKSLKNLNNTLDPAILTLNQASDELINLRAKVSVLQELFAPERDAVHVDKELIRGLSEMLNGLFNDMLLIGSNLDTASRNLQAII